MKKTLLILFVFSFALNAQEYNVQSIPFNPPTTFDSGIQLNVVIDDIYSDIIPIPFDFDFYGNSYNEIVVGSNGSITFDVSVATGFSPWNIGSDIPSAQYTSNSIFGVFHDVNSSTSSTAQINYGFLGTAPNRKMYINFYEIPHFSCEDLISTTQIVLSEETNNIEVFILDKPSCTSWNDGRAILGIQNENATVAHVVDGRNGLDPSWTASAEGWLFGSINIISLGEDIETCDTSVTLDFEQGNPAYGYSWRLNGEVIPGATSPIYIAAESGLYQAIATDGTETVMDEILITLNEAPEIETAPSTIFIDDGDGDSTAIFDLTINEGQMLGGQNPADIVFSYFETATECETNINLIVNPTAYQNILNPQTIYVRLENVNTGCFVCTNFLIETDGELGFDDNILESLQIFPNPANDLINIALNDLAFAEILIRDIQGREIKRVQGENDLYSINVSALNKGVYFLTVTVGNTNVTQRFIKE